MRALEIRVLLQWNIAPTVSEECAGAAFMNWESARSSDNRESFALRPREFRRLETKASTLVATLLDQVYV